MYIDSSSKMIQLSKKRNIAFNTIEFIQASIEDINLCKQKYDVVLTPFLFDNFSQSTSEFVFKKLNASLKSDGYWLYIDFYISEKSSYQQKSVLKLMYVFFRLICKIEANRLPIMDDYFLSYKIISDKYYCKNFIIMQIFKKI
jgi:ubiquinone/menaquinone biosynthesis C-methylase UbiE